MRELGELVRRARDEMGLTQAEVGKRIGRPTSFVSRLETGVMKELPQPAEMRALARVLPVTVPEMLAAAGYDIELAPPTSALAGALRRLEVELRPLAARPDLLDRAVEHARSLVAMYEASRRPAPGAPAESPPGSPERHDAPVDR